MRALVPVLAFLLAASVPAQEPARSEVLVLGTIHAPIQFRVTDYTPAHIRAVLELARPDVVGVESHPEWFAQGRFYDVTYEAQNIAVPWARARKIPVYGVDWLDLPKAEEHIAAFDRDWRKRIETALASGQRRGMFGDHLLGDEGRAYLVDQAPWTFAKLNVDPAVPRGDPEAPGFGGRRNRGIVEHCLAVMQDHPGKRLVVVVGAGHKAVLDLLFAKADGVRVLQMDRDVPLPTEEQVAAQWTAVDLVVALGHNLDGERLYFHPELVDQERMTRLLGMLVKREGDPRVVRYFTVRLAAVNGDHEAALRGLEALLAEPGTDAVGREILYPFPLAHWRMVYDMRQACLLEQAAALRALGRNDEAEAPLAALAATLEPPAAELDDAQWRARALAHAYPAAMVAPAAAPQAVAKVAPVEGTLGLRDPGFESGAVAAAPIAGWYAPRQGDGNVVFAADRSEKVEGACSLRIEVRTVARDRPCFLSQAVRVEAGSELRFGLALRARGIAKARLVVYVWDRDQRAREIAARELRLKDAWQRYDLEFAVPAGHERVGLYLYPEPIAGGRLWLDDARLGR